MNTRSAEMQAVLAAISQLDQAWTHLPDDQVLSLSPLMMALMETTLEVVTADAPQFAVPSSIG